MPSQRQTQKMVTARRIFEAAVTLFARQGYAATTVEQIVQAAGVAKGTFFTHFASKEALLDHIATVQLERIATAIAADPAFATRPWRQQLHTIVAALAHGLASQPAEMRILTSEIIARRSLFEGELQGINALDVLIEQIIAQAQTKGQVRTDRPAIRLAALTRSTYFTALFEWVRNDQLDLPQLAAQYLDVTLDGLEAQGR